MIVRCRTGKNINKTAIFSSLYTLFINMTFLINII